MIVREDGNNLFIPDLESDLMIGNMDALQRKDIPSMHVEDHDGDKNENYRPLSHDVSEKTTRRMIFFACYISIAGTIYNFDLGK